MALKGSRWDILLLSAHLLLLGLQKRVESGDLTGMCDVGCSWQDHSFPIVQVPTGRLPLKF